MTKIRRAATSGSVRIKPKRGAPVIVPFGHTEERGIVIRQRSDGRYVVRLLVQDTNGIEASYDPAEITPAPQPRGPQGGSEQEG